MLVRRAGAPPSTTGPALRRADARAATTRLLGFRPRCAPWPRRVESRAPGRNPSRPGARSTARDCRRRASRVRHLPQRIESGLVHGLRQRGVRMNRMRDLFGGELVRACDDDLVNHFRRVRAHDVGAEDLAVLRVANDLHEAFCLTRGTRATIRREIEPADLVVELLFLALRFRETD